MTDMQRELQYLEDDAREMLEDEMRGWISCDEGHRIHPDALHCDTCRQIALEYMTSRTPIQLAAVRKMVLGEVA